jgi:hypothetical protein
MLEREHVDGVGCPTGVGVGVFINGESRLPLPPVPGRPPQVFHAIAKNDPMAWRPANHRSHGGMVKVAGGLEAGAPQNRRLRLH